MTAVIGHYGNWDWMASVPLWSDKFIVGTLYKRIKNKFFNNLFLKIRSRFGVYCIDMKQALRGLSELNKKEKPNIIAYIADQSTPRKNIHYWIKFLNQDTAVQSGWTTIARRFDTIVLYLKITPIKNGYYTAHFEVITETPKSMSETELITAYFNRLEKDIKEKPEYWLWSHKRWKHKKEV
jgi:KDO2-lipid IV(A) lauroyltransferase